MATDENRMYRHTILPSQNRMSNYPGTSLQRLKTAKGNISAAMTHVFSLCEQIGEIKVPEQIKEVAPDRHEKVGDVLFEIGVVLASAGKHLEFVTNAVREAEGKEPLDYTGSHSNVVLDKFKEHCDELAEELFSSDAGKGDGPL